MKFTVIGGSGFIGAAMVQDLLRQGHEVHAPRRGVPLCRDQGLGHVIYAAGVTADFRQRPFDTLHAHVTVLTDILELGRFDSLLYLSSARVYRHASTTKENSEISVRPADPEDLYDLTKLTGEALCHASRNPSIRILRLTNVIGKDYTSKNFLFDLIRTAYVRGVVELRSAPDSQKDYVALQDVVDLSSRIALSGSQRIYNIGSGSNVKHSDILDQLVAITGTRILLMPDSPLVIHPIVNIELIREEFQFSPKPIIPYIKQLITNFRNSL